MYNAENTVERISSAGLLKGYMPLGRLFFSGFLAGAYIAAGFFLSVTSAASFTTTYSLYRIMLGVFFPAGLVAVLFAGSELWTGNVLFMSVTLLKKRCATGAVVRNWMGSYTGNFAGALFVAWMVTRGTGLVNGNVLIQGQVVAAAVNKSTGGFVRLFLLGVLCNWLVDLAIWMFNRAEGTSGRVLLVWMPIFAFVALGFEHSIANMWIIPSAIFSSGAVTWAGFFKNIVPVTMGNAAGGLLLVAVPYTLFSSGAERVLGGILKTTMAIAGMIIALFAIPVAMTLVTDNIWLIPLVFVLNGIVMTYIYDRIHERGD